MKKISEHDGTEVLMDPNGIFRVKRGGHVVNNNLYKAIRSKPNTTTMQVVHHHNVKVDGTEYTVSYCKERYQSQEITVIVSCGDTVWTKTIPKRSRT